MLILNVLDNFKSYYSNVLEKILRFVQREMTSNEGAFYSSQDADSEGKGQVVCVVIRNSRNIGCEVFEILQIALSYPRR